MIETARLIVRPWQPEEVERFVELYRRPEVVRWFPDSPMIEREEALERIKQNLVCLAENPRFGRWAIVDRSKGVPVGTIILAPLPNGHGEVEIGWHLHPDSWGQGLASEAARAVLEHAFAGGLSEVWAVTDPENERSVAVCERIGMQLLGLTYRWYHEPSLMFWAGANPGQTPTLSADEPARS